VVILTMIASMQFDPRLIWDTVEGADSSVKKKAKRASRAQDAKGSTQQSQDPKHD
jgi:paraquat-inducible protein A